MEARNLKENLGIKAKDIILSGLGQKEIKGKIHCPFHQDSTPSMSWFEDGLMFRCHACSKTMDIFTYYTEIENIEFKEAIKQLQDLTGETDTLSYKVKAKKTFNKPTLKASELSQEAIEYMTKRGITQRTLEDWKVKETVWNNNEVYVFQYFDEKKELQFVTYRGIGKGGIKGGCQANTKSILWGMDHIDINKPVVITEGQPDAMIVWQSGYKNVVSVPSGAMNKTWIDNCWQWLKSIKEFIIWADNDEPGRKSAIELQKALGVDRTKIIMHNTCKDANELHFKQCAAAVLKLIQEGICETPQGIINMGMRKSVNIKQDTFKTGFNDLDKHLKGLKTSQLTIVFGRDNEGKSTFVSQMIPSIIASGEKVFLYSGELTDDNIEKWIMNQIIGDKKGMYNKKVDEWGEDIYIVKDEIKQQIREWYKDKFFTFEKKIDITESNYLFKTLELAFKRYGVKFFVIDNLMTALEEESDSLNSEQSNFIKKCKKFSLSFNVHVVVICHPNKEKEEGETLTKNDVSGTKNITNAADNVIAIERVWESLDYNSKFIDESYKKKDFKGYYYSAIMRILKEREGRGRSVLHYYFNPASNRFYNEEVEKNVDYLELIPHTTIKFGNGQVQTFKHGEMKEEICPF